MHDNDGWLDTANTDQRRILDLRTLGMRHALSLGRFHYNRASGGLEEQRQDSWLVLVFVLLGSQHYLVDGDEIQVRGGQGLRILPGQRYGTGAWPEQRGDLAWLILKAKPLPRGRALGMGSAGAREVFSRLTDPALPQVFEQPAGMRQNIESAFDAWNLDDQLLRDEIVRNRVTSLVLGSVTALSRPRGSSPGSSERIQPILDRIRSRLDDPPEADQLAAMAGLSPSRFYEEFKQVTGTTPRDYILRARIEQASRRLDREPDLTVTRLAYDLGFSSSQYFSTVFRRYLGSSPSSWRSGREAR